METFGNKEYEYKQNLVGEGYLRRPTLKNNIRLNVIGEIVQANNFEGSEINIGWEFIIPMWYKLDYEDLFEVEPNPSDQQIEDWNKVSSITHSTKSSLQQGENGDETLVANFCFPFDLQLQTHKDFYEFQRMPILLMYVQSIDSWNRSRIEGYSFCEIPRETGFHQIKVKSWTPQQSLYSQVHSFYLGGSQKVKEIKKIAQTSFITDENIESTINRFKVNTESTGTIVLRFNIAAQSQEFKQAKRYEAREQERGLMVQRKKQQFEATQEPSYINLKGQSGIRTDHGNFLSRYQNSTINQ